MTEYFIVAESFAAPFCSDSCERFVEAETPEIAINRFRDGYKHPAGLYAAVCFRDANARAKGEKPLAKWLCNHEIAKERLTKDVPAYIFSGHGPGSFEINGKAHRIENPKGGRFVTC